MNKIRYYTGKLKVFIQYKFLGLIYRKKIKKGDVIQCFGIGYPHWKGEIFLCTADFKDGTIGIRSCIRVSAKDFKVI